VVFSLLGRCLYKALKQTRVVSFYTILQFIICNYPTIRRYLTCTVEKPSLYSLCTCSTSTLLTSCFSFSQFSSLSTYFPLVSTCIFIFLLSSFFLSYFLLFLLYFFPSRHPNSGQNQNIRTADESFENVTRFKYLGTTLTDQIMMNPRVD
jgi:hypothetical protein